MVGGQLPTGQADVYEPWPRYRHIGLCRASKRIHSVGGENRAVHTARQTLRVVHYSSITRVAFCHLRAFYDDTRHRALGPLETPATRLSIKKPRYLSWRDTSGL